MWQEPCSWVHLYHRDAMLAKAYANMDAPERKRLKTSEILHKHIFIYYSSLIYYVICIYSFHILENHDTWKKISLRSSSTNICVHGHLRILGGWCSQVLLYILYIQSRSTTLVAFARYQNCCSSNQNQWHWPKCYNKVCIPVNVTAYHNCCSSNQNQWHRPKFYNKVWLLFNVTTLTEYF